MAVTSYKVEDDTLIEWQIGADSHAKVYPLICDRLTLTSDIPLQYKKPVIEAMKEMGAKKQGMYKYSCSIKDVPATLAPYHADEEAEDKITSAYIQCDPASDDIGFIRLDCNPARINLGVFKEYLANTALNYNIGFDYLLKHGKVTRIDFAVDIDSEQVEDLYYHYDKMKYVEIVHTKSGRTEYIGGKTKTEKRVVIYDRTPAIKAHNYKKSYFPPLQIPVPEQDIMRVEIRLRPNKSFVDLHGMTNPFKPLCISAPKPNNDDLPWKLFLPLARFEGAQASLARLSKHMRKVYKDKLEKAAVPWWHPDKIWEQYPKLMSSIEKM